MKIMPFIIICLVLVSFVFVISNFDDEEGGDEMGDNNNAQKTYPLVSPERSEEIARENIRNHIESGGDKKLISPEFEYIYQEIIKGVNK